MAEHVADDRRVVITGMGALTPLGNSWPETWAGLLEGRSGVDKITAFDASEFPTRIAGEVRGFDPAALLPVKRRKRSSRASQLAVAASREAVADAGLGPSLEDVDAGVVINSAVSGYPEIQDATEAYALDGIRAISPSFVASSLTNMAACEVAIDLGVHGPVNASALACASGTAALLDARRTLLAGEADVVIAGGTDAAITPVMFAGLTTMRGLSRNNDSPQEASRPFDADRDGFVFGEGAVVCTLELLSHARARGARVYAEVLGGAMTSDAFHIVAPDPSGRYAAQAIAQALRRARLDPSDVELVAAHGTSTLANDRTETMALRQAFGAHADGLAVTAPKSMTGHLIGAAGTLASLLCAMAIVEGVIPPTINYATPDPECDLDYVPGVAREQRVRHAITNAFGFGGQNCVLAFGPV
ncbi:beta-ketoacyl-[acyl-carrier-protein] synthase family protein [Cellulomonas chengniuliangii]|uniref:3-oxoacyl-[acyl-carrier-protein] synthase 2 n=1 Tax=Cellulomonas chengniuliangii TaxID=2968084 RepID=A0ABY5L5F0_9CELL|nr:beta-ketoacyl-[acyl-carrier-protein] synthase II [Cellulomonas chengniuliangii]MCC2308838.1 beta-ketoacyl-[acyl-carrier-protein] synthase II [Cellulomonas chengniuliangii]UUI77004.1 beta-ketoacyl-[acyl-carrier-protein] synthase II [Cellulomonas chengniuliangii]